MVDSTKESTTVMWLLSMNLYRFRLKISKQCQHGVNLISLFVAVLGLLRNHSVPERTIDLKALGQFEDIDSSHLNHLWLHLGFIQKHPSSANTGSPFITVHSRTLTIRKSLGS